MRFYRPIGGPAFALSLDSAESTGSNRNMGVDGSAGGASGRTAEPPEDRRSALITRLALVILAAGLYLGIPIIRQERPRPPGRFPQLAAAFLEGRFALHAPLPNANELIPAGSDDAFYVPYPPLPAILLMPFVALLGAVKVETACRIVSVLNVALFHACVPGVLKIFDRPSMTRFVRAPATLLFAFGTATWHNAAMAGDWHYAHAVALGAALLALREFTGKNRAAIVGLFVAAVIATRPTAALACVFFPIAYARAASPAGRRMILRFVAGPVAAIAALAVYNQLRFGSPWEFGYERMVLGGEGRRLMDLYGQFHPHFIPINAFWFFLAPPALLPSAGFPWLGFHPRGLSLFIATPAFLYAMVALRDWRRRPAVRHAAISIAACLCVLLMHFNTGYWQFGHRFSMDYLPMLMVLTLAGMTGARRTNAGRLPMVGLALIVVSIAINAWGVLWARAVALPPSIVPV